MAKYEHTLKKTGFEIKAPIKAVIPESPADDAGFGPGCALTTINGQIIRDSIDWMWHSADDVIELGYIDTDGDRGTVVLEREGSEDWGFEFEGAIYDRIKRCHNNCIFCFMSQLPEDVRDTLVLRDDDFRLSFLQGTFVTLTNLSPDDEARIIEQHISPLRLSLHCVTPQVRAQVIGGKKSHLGLAAAERLLEAGIEFHAQIVLMPAINDGEELAQTLEWAYKRPGIITLGIVPLGFTKHQSRFEKSFNNVKDARAVIECIRPYQKRALAERGEPWVYAADEFYCNAFPNSLLDELPPSSYYGDFEMFEDGIGIVRSFVDDWYSVEAEMPILAGRLRALNKRFLFVTGEATKSFFVPLFERSPLHDLIVPVCIQNNYFGGNIDVTGLLCACDIVEQVQRIAKEMGIKAVLIPKVLFNADNVTLDDMSLEDMQAASALEMHVVSCNASEFLGELNQLIDDSE